MSIGIQPSKVSMQGMGGPLNLRSNHDKSRHNELIQNQNNLRHNAFLKEMLVNGQEEGLGPRKIFKMRWLSARLANTSNSFALDVHRMHYVLFETMDYQDLLDAC